MIEADKHYPVVVTNSFWSEVESKGSVKPVIVITFKFPDTSTMDYTLYFDPSNDDEQQARLVQNLKALGIGAERLGDQSDFWDLEHPIPDGTKCDVKTKEKVSARGKTFVVIHYIVTEGSFYQKPKAGAGKRARAAFLGLRPSLHDAADDDGAGEPDYDEGPQP